MKFSKNSELFSLNRTTYVNLRWIAFLGQIISILIVEFIFEYKFNYIPCLGIITLGPSSNRLFILPNNVDCCNTGNGSPELNIFRPMINDSGSRLTIYLLLLESSTMANSVDFNHHGRACFKSTVLLSK